MQGVKTPTNFEVWDGTRCDVILDMAWLQQVDV